MTASQRSSSSLRTAPASSGAGWPTRWAQRWHRDIALELCRTTPPKYSSASFDAVAADLYRMARLGPADVGVVQCYENLTGGVVMALAEHDFFAPGEANHFLTLENLLAPSIASLAPESDPFACRSEALG